jgi:hypothetical protein
MRSGRLDAVWSHFWARGKVYKHFWQSGPQVETGPAPPPPPPSPVPSGSGGYFAGTYCPPVAVCEDTADGQVIGRIAHDLALRGAAPPAVLDAIAAELCAAPEPDASAGEIRALLLFLAANLERDATGALRVRPQHEGDPRWTLAEWLALFPRGRGANPGFASGRVPVSVATATAWVHARMAAMWQVDPPAQTARREVPPPPPTETRTIVVHVPVDVPVVVPSPAHVSGWFLAAVVAVGAVVGYVFAPLPRTAPAPAAPRTRQRRESARTPGDLLRGKH